MTKLVDLLDQLKHRRTFGFMDDFDWYLSPHRWTSVVPQGAVTAEAAGVGGILQLNTSGGSPALNDEAYVKSTTAPFSFAANKPLVFEAAIQFSEADANKANIAIGLMDGVAAGSLADASGGPKNSYSGMIFYKQGNHNSWSCQSSVGGAQYTTPTNIVAGLDGYQTLTGQWQPISATQGEARFFIDGVLVAKQLITFTGAQAMHLFAGAKTGSAYGQTLQVDYLAAYQLR